MVSAIILPGLTQDYIPRGNSSLAKTSGSGFRNGFMTRVLRRRAAAFWNDTNGVILPYVTMMLVVIIGLCVLALDGARYMNLQSQLQNGADALALAGAAELDRLPDSQIRAVAAINNLVTNRAATPSPSATNLPSTRARPASSP
jgi:Flp pilus assembly protein TadG